MRRNTAHRRIQSSNKSNFMISRFLVAIGFVVFALHATNLACSYADGALFPTHYDHIKEAAVIVLAEPIGKIGYNVEFRIKEVMKGSFEDQEFTASEVHTSCTDLTFVLQQEATLPPFLAAKIPKRTPKYLLFLERTTDSWKLSIQATEAMNSPVWDEQSSESLLAVRQLIRVSNRNDYEAEKRELKELRRIAKSGRQPRKYPKSLVKLIDDHLRSPTPKKTFQDLIEIYGQSERDGKRDVLWALAKGGHKEATEFFTRMLDSPIPSNYVGPISQFIITTRNAALLLRIGRNYPILDKSTRWPLMWALIKTADGRHADLMMAALKSADKEEAGRLAEWFVRYPNEEATEIVNRLVAGAYQENWELTFGLAGMGDPGTVSWAKEFMNKDGKDRWMAFYTIAYSPLDEADRLARDIIEGTDSRGLTFLIQGYGDSHNPRKYKRLYDIVRLTKKDSEVENWLRRTLDTMSENGDPRASELKRLLSGG
ncbi:MAG: hypothetical protein HOP17_16705 [Acidobacteria bacterium]|nr:hypothetical protein [Acidobacteriota bacterium]